MEFSEHLVLLDECNATLNMFKQASAVVTLLKETVEMESLAGSRIVQNVKKGVMKEARERAAARGKRVRSVMTIDHIRLFIGKLYKRPARKVKPADRRFLVKMLLLFFGMKRFDDVKELKVCDITVLEGGDLEFYVARSKMDQEGNGFVFHVTGEKFKGFSIPGVLDWYMESNGLTDTDFLFPRFRNEKGNVWLREDISLVIVRLHCS